MATTRILGIDPGTIRCGWAVIERSGNQLAHVASGVISPPQKAPMSERLLEVHAGIQEVVLAWAPAEAAIEMVYHGLNAQTAIKLGQARGAAIIAIAAGGRAVHEYEASVVKQRTTGLGNATKEQVRSMVALMFRLPDDMVLDRSDALAVAICHARQHPMLKVSR